MEAHSHNYTRVVNAVAQHFSCTKEELMGKSRIPRIRMARAVMYWTLNQWMSMEDISNRCERGSTSSVHSSICTFLSSVRRDRQYRAKCLKMIEELGEVELRDRLLP